MKKKYITLLLSLVFAICVGFYLLYTPKTIECLRTDSVDQLSKETQNLGNYKPITPKRIPKQPKLFRYTEYPPKTQEGEAMWQWWRAMGKSDPMFGRRMPLEFYGIVRDQFGRPVDDVAVRVQITGPDRLEEYSLITRADGRFSLGEKRGASLLVSDLSKEGYLRTQNCAGRSYEYARFFDPRFHEPNKSKPEEFLLYRFQNPEPLYVFRTRFSTAPGIVSKSVDVSNGRVGEVGDFALVVIPKGDISEEECNFELIVRCSSGAGAITSNEDFMFSPPEVGYSTELHMERGKKFLNRTTALEGQIYVRTREGKFAAVKLEIFLNRGHPQIDATVFFNPSGSRNLEFDSAKQINRY